MLMPRRSSSLAKHALVALGLILAGVSAGIGFVYSGLADVGATSPHWPLTEWVLSTTMKNAVARRARRIEPPPFLADEARVRAGAAAYDAMCASCHGAPGVEPEMATKGLNPAAPDLAEEAGEWSASELFWIVEHGVRMTGMPAFGATHSDGEIWEIVAFVGRLHELSPVRYRELTGPRDEGRGRHQHGPDRG